MGQDAMPMTGLVTSSSGGDSSNKTLAKSDERRLKRMKANYAALDEQKLIWTDGY
jgi:hypothetical protein